MNKLTQNYRKIGLIAVALLLAAFTISFTIKQQQDPEKDKVLISLLKFALTKGHYQPKDFNDALSEKVYNDFIENLDPRKRYFMQSDLDEFSKYKFAIDDQINSEDLSFFKLVYGRFDQRLKEVNGFYKSLLTDPFDFNVDETISIKYQDLSYSKSEAERLKAWQKELKLNTISRLNDRLETEKDKFKTDKNYQEKSFASLEIESREATLKSMEAFFERMLELNEEDSFSAFLNTITSEFDPHTAYLAPEDKKRFDITMAGKLEGIGARLQKKNDYTKIVEIISGGPAWKKGELEVGDMILKVAQGNDEPKDIVGMRLDDAVELIKGKKGTEVKLTIKKIDGTIKVISIIRDVVELEETFAKSAIVNKDGNKYGVIELPKFYIDFNEKDSRNSATDMEKQVAYLKQENVKGILIDLRNNGGGSLSTAIDIAGLFIKSGPVVQVRYRNEKALVQEDKNKKIQWEGSLVILVNELSASASEIFAAAMQDYNRAVIIGSKQTFGKGTVQNILTLNNYVNYPEDLGALKMTIQKFYRVNGGSTQLKGVTSDVALPDRYAFMEIGERDEQNPLTWDKIESVNYTPWNGYANFDEVVNQSKVRVQSNAYFNLANQNAKWLKQQQKISSISLNFKNYKKDLDQSIQESKSYNGLNDFDGKFDFKSPTYELAELKKDSVLAQKRAEWHKNLSKDAYVDEALNILAQLKLKPQEQLVKN
ncbi:MAG: tail-specific protease [Flavobacteriales bacterium CG11_big_fil_rev_8_21_14_0_20_35_7]|nr:MAG: tail-specific protease [Flavobacteriales bacterium CG11_big_fil_rev_8_21_14_0_20_35_7]